MHQSPRHGAMQNFPQLQKVALFGKIYIRSNNIQSLLSVIKIIIFSHIKERPPCSKFYHCTTAYDTPDVEYKENKQRKKERNKQRKETK